ncbi:hypothetical protein K438DRAFT_676949 [Mycena galopus ATCC 62051]|nr:hypothetical protein K438DRAFT_676949 [Mycena galopus ATCC 62051]
MWHRPSHGPESGSLRFNVIIADCEKLRHSNESMRISVRCRFVVLKHLSYLPSPSKWGNISQSKGQSTWGNYNQPSLRPSHFYFLLLIHHETFFVLSRRHKHLPCLNSLGRSPKPDWSPDPVSRSLLRWWYRGTNCTRQDTQCQCASPAYAANITQCGTSNCNFTAAFMQASLASGCASDGFPISSLTASSTGSGGASPTGSSAPNTAQFSVNHVGVAATSAVGLIFYALLV